MKKSFYIPLFVALLTITFLIYDSFYLFKSSSNSSKWVELIQNLIFVVLGVTFSWQIKSNNKNTNKKSLIDSNKLMLEVMQDENKQLKEKVKTLEMAINKLTQ